MSKAKPKVLIYILILCGFTIGCLALTGLLRLTAWSEVLLILQLTVGIACVGTAVGILTKSFVGRGKGLRSNVLGSILVILVLLAAGVPIIQVYFDPVTTMSTIGRSFGTVLYPLSFGGTVELGRYIACQIRTLRHTADMPREGEQSKPANRA